MLLKPDPGFTTLDFWVTQLKLATDIDMNIGLEVRRLSLCIGFTTMKSDTSFSQLP